MANTAMEIMAVTQGSYIVNDTTEATKTFDTILVLEDTVFSSIKISGTDVKADYISTPGTAVKAGAIIRPTDGKFSGVQLTSGSVMLVL